MDNINFNKDPLSSEFFNQDKYYEENFEKINQEVVPKITDLEANKVDKVTGKGLSTNDFSNEYKKKIDTDIPAQLNEIESRSLKVKNILLNGDFSNDMTNWIRRGCTGIVENGELKMTATSAWGQNFQVVDCVVNNKYYTSVKIKADFNARFESTNDEQQTSYGVINHSGNNTPQHLSITFTPTLSNKLRVRVVDTRSSNWTPIYIDNHLLINLTNVFGAGNEPTKSEMDTLINLIGWFDGEVSVTEKQLAIWTLNLIRQNRNAIIALGGTII